VSEKRAEDTRKELRELTKTVDLLREASQGYDVVRNQFLDTFKKNRLHFRSKALNERIDEMNKSVHGGDAATDAHQYINGSRKSLCICIA
jgi:hypothetical protein